MAHRLIGQDYLEFSCTDRGSIATLIDCQPIAEILSPEGFEAPSGFELAFVIPFFLR